MRFVLESLRHVAIPKGPHSLATLFACGGAALAALVVFYGALFGTGESAAEADTVVVNGPVFSPVSVAPPAPAPASKPYGSNAPRFDDAVSITRAVQTELKRAACYSGPINGVWTASTQAAMGEFAARVNARLPIHRADPVLLALLETHNKISCTGDCSMGEGQACEQRATLPSRRSNEVASVEQDRPAGTREEPHASPEGVQANAGAEDPGLSDGAQGAPNPIASIQAASVEGDDAAAMSAAAGASQKITKPERRRTARKYRTQPSFSRSVQKGLKSLQRSFSKLF